jgi:hypothetical protein
MYPIVYLAVLPSKHLWGGNLQFRLFYMDEESMKTKRWFFITLLVLIPAFLSAQTIEANQYAIWGIDDNKINIPTGSIITEAVLTIQNVAPQNASLYVHLLDNTKKGIEIGTNAGSGDYFNSCGILLSGTYEKGNYVCRFSQNNNPQSPIRAIFPSPTSVTLADSSTVQLSSALLELMDYAGNGRGFGIGIDSAENAPFTFSSLTLKLTVSSYQGQPAEQFLTFSTTAALEFDGVDDYIEIGDSRPYTTYTLSAWVRPQIAGAQYIMVLTDSAGVSSITHNLRINASGKFVHYLWDGSAKTVTGTTTVVPGTWYHITGEATQNGYMRLYVNGIEEGTAVAIGTPWTSGARWLIGRVLSSQTGSYSYFKGTIDTVRIWNRALTAQEVLASVDGNPGGVGPVGDWKLDEGAGTTAYDRSGNGYNGTIYGGPTWINLF